MSVPIRNAGRVIWPLKDHAWSQMDPGKDVRGAQRKARRFVERDGISFWAPNPATPEKPFHRKRSRFLAFKGTLGFPEGIWVGQTGYLTPAEHGPDWEQSTVMDISDDEYRHLESLSKDPTYQHMTMADKVQDAKEKKRIQSDADKFGIAAHQVAAAGSIQQQIAAGIKAYMVEQEDIKKRAKDAKRITKERAGRQERVAEAHERETIEAGDSRGTA